MAFSRVLVDFGPCAHSVSVHSHLGGVLGEETNERDGLPRSKLEYMQRECSKPRSNIMNYIG
jgi:hypothetical protein